MFLSKPGREGNLFPTIKQQPVDMERMIELEKCHLATIRITDSGRNQQNVKHERRQELQDTCIVSKCPLPKYLFPILIPKYLFINKEENNSTVSLLGLHVGELEAGPTRDICTRLIIAA